MTHSQSGILRDNKLVDRRNIDVRLRTPKIMIIKINPSVN